MNLLKLSSVVALSATTLLGGATVLADGQAEAETKTKEVRNTNTNASVEFEANGETDTIVRPPEEGPDGGEVDIDVDGGEGNNTGPLTIAYVPTFDFGEQEISSSLQSYPLIAEMQKLKNDPNTEVPYVSFVQVQDTRGTSEGWHLDVTLSEFEAGPDHDGMNPTLVGAEIHFLDSTLNYVPGDADQEPTLNMTENFVLRPSTGAQRLMTAANKRGAGTTDIIWGNQAELNKQFEDNNKNPENATEVLNEAIQLVVPGTHGIDATDYTATLEWTLTAGVENNE